jgi:single-strand DNA-binding protein
MVNKVILVGRVGKDPEVRYLDSGIALCKFTLATNEKYKNKNGENVENTEWHNIILWRKLAEIAEKYVKKGDMLYLDGKISTRSYDDKDGIKKFFTEIIAENLKMLSKKGDNGSSQQDSQEQPQEQTGSFDDIEPAGGDDLPF